MDIKQDADIQAWAKALGVEYAVALTYLAQRGLRAIQNASKAGRAAQARLTEEERSERGKRAIEARWAKAKGSLRA